MIGVVTFYRVQNIDDRARLAVAMQLQRLTSALDHADDQSTQQLLDAAIRRGHDADLVGVELLGADGRLQRSGRVDAVSLEHYPGDLSTRDGRTRQLTAHVDPAPRRHAQHLVGMYALGAGLGVLLLTLLAVQALRHRVIQPLRRLQRSLSDTIAARGPHAAAPEEDAEFVQLQASSMELRRLLDARGREATTILHDSEIEALDQLRQSQAALRGKSQFVALVGHHFRQPLQALQLFAGSLHPGIDAEQQAAITQMRSSVADMTRLLDALLEISRLDAEVVAAHPAPIHAAELFRHWRAELSLIARGNDVLLHWHATAHALVGDVDVIGALLVQLVSNAVACSPPHGRVLIAARRRGERIRIEVRDHGPGIAAIHHQRIFEEFVRLHDQGERSHGFGLGLAIATRLARLLQTEVGVRSKRGRGSTFYFELPCSPLPATSTPVLPVRPGRDLNVADGTPMTEPRAADGHASILAPMPSSERAMS